MNRAYEPLYVPALRMKTGELLGLSGLSPDVAGCILPRMIIPPSEERDLKGQLSLFSGDKIPDISGSISPYWRNREVLVDFEHIVDEFDESRIDVWLPKMFEMARKSQVKAIPAISGELFIKCNNVAFRNSISSEFFAKAAVVISSSSVLDREFLEKVFGKVADIGVSQSECVVIVDFSDSDFTVSEIVSPIISGVLETIQAMGKWKKIAFQGTNYPEKNPAEPDSYYTVPRNEWIAWRKATKFEIRENDQMIFGDYAADCAKISFGGKGGKPIRHYRYTTPEAWIVQRGPSEGKHESSMKKVCEKIIASDYFAGRDFSSADDFIYKTAKGFDGPGNAKDWRAVNTTHHITQVVYDIGVARGMNFSRKKTREASEQISMFE